MPSLLEELKQQREQIKKHLEWLDGKIVELSKDDAEGGRNKSVAPTPTPSESEHASNAAEPPEEAKGKAVLFVPDTEAPTYKAKTQGELRRAQIGCLVLFVLCTSLFLFLLFGLPYLLPEKADVPSDEMIEEVLIDEAPEENSSNELAE